MFFHTVKSNQLHIGEAFMFGLDVQDDVAMIQQLTGVCSQEDLLWLELTARQHLELFARFKGVPERHIDVEVKRVLDEINLTFDGDNRAATFSGGMKRRLSVGMASIGAPRIIFLDEPTTGGSMPVYY
eukprot:SAG31_NODE_241_length_19364_cov_17.168544_9_plen_128_part_00